VTDDDISPATARALRHRLAVGQRDGRVPSVVAAIARRAEPVWFAAAGRVSGDVPGEQTQYRVGSITKTMVAVCVLRLVERGDLALTDRLGDHLPDAPAGDSTVVQLLSHTAGLASETPAPWWERTSGDVRPELTDVLTPDPRRHGAGERFHYSNPGFGLLGALVTSIAGRPWFDMLADEVLTPLGMTRTSYLPIAPHADGWAVHPWADVLLPEPAHDHGLLAPAGQVWSTPSDLCRFGVFLAGDGRGILSRETLERMRRPTVAPDDSAWTGSYGLGVQHFRFGDHVVFGHSGSMPGFQAMLCSSAEDGLTIGLQANAWSSLALGALAGDLLAIVREHEPTMPVAWEPATMTTPDAVELIGPWYWGAVAMAFTLRSDGDLHLAGIGARGRAARFERMPDGRWRGRDGYYAGEFLEVVRREDGTLSHLDIGSFVFTRDPYAPGDAVPDGLGLGDWQF
jgi:CubicO group peptidase (beta-lactamase class C family)